MRMLYCRDGFVVAIHDDTQNVPATLYGDGVRIVPVPDTLVLERSGAAPLAGEPDTRKIVVPAATDTLLVAYAAHRRWLAEVKGITIGGNTIATDRESQNLINGAVAAAKDNPSTVFRFKTAAGFVTLDADLMVAIGRAVYQHVQACFSAEGDATAAIAAGTATTFAAVDAFFTEL